MIDPSPSPQPPATVARISPSRSVRLDRGWKIDAALVLLIAAAIGLLASRIYPVWTDDACYAKLVGQGQTLYSRFLDRPFIGWFWQFWEQHGGYFRIAGVVHWLSWSCLALGAMWVWRLLFPQWRRFGLAAACFVLAPVLCEAQWVLINFPITGVIGPSIATIALGLLLANQGSGKGFGWRVVVAAALVFLAGQLSEYSAPAAVAAAAILALRPWWGTKRSEPMWRGFVAAALLVSAAVVSYAIYHSLGQPLARVRVRPELLLANSVGWRLKIFLPRLISQFWLATVGAIGSFVGRIRFDSVPTLIAGAVGAATALLVTVRFRKAGVSGADSAEAGLASDGFSAPALRSLAILCVALLCGLVPMIVMGAISEGRGSSRYLLPVLPIASITTIAVLLRVLNRRLWCVIPVFAGFAVGYGQTSEFLWARQDERSLVKWSAEVRKHVAPEGLTIAVFDSRWAHSDLTAGPFELTYWLTASPAWSEEQRQHFWAFGSLESTDTSKGTVDLFSDHPSMELFIRGVGRKGPVSRILWLRPEGNSFSVRTVRTPVLSH